MVHGAGLTEMLMVQGIIHKAQHNPGSVRYTVSLPGHQLVMKYTGGRKETTRATWLASGLGADEEALITQQVLDGKNCQFFEWNFSMIQEKQNE